MQRQLLISFFSFALLSFKASAQFVIVNSPANISGSKDYGLPDAWGADLLSDVWTADAVLVDDGVAPTSDGCSDPVNAAALNGKFALIDRGSCEFGDKALRAQTAGALGVVIMNNAAGAGAPGMLAGTYGAQVTIPVVMISYEDGLEIKTALQTGTVNMTIGNVVFAHNLHIASDRVTVPFNGTMPVYESEASTDVFTPAVEVQNLGSENATGVTVTCVITFTPAGGGASVEVYNESDQATEAIETDSVEVVGLPTFVPTNGEGTYNIVYTASADIDDDILVNDDQVVESQFNLTDNLYSKGRYDATNDRPLKTVAYTTATARDNEYIAPFEVPKGLGYKLDSLVFYAESSVSFGSNTSTLEGWVYEWDDLSGDSTITNDEITIVGYVPSDFIVATDTSATSQWFKVPIIEWEDLETEGYVVPGDNKRYLVGLRYTNSDAANYYRVGFDDVYDQTVNLNYGLALYDTHLPYIGISGWANNAPDFGTRFRFTDFWGSLATGLILTPYVSPSIEVAPANVAVTLSPNPASNKLVVESKLNAATKSVSYAIRDNNGRLVYNSTKALNSDYDKASFDVSKFAAGQYFIVITTDQGTKAERFTVQH
ncbi:MAG: T9SS type A sorting domain-containing protein [Bacteroidetes bacterium]|nr:T9SS type A sorting domain-containing protein [Bacteroidota bacterium]